MSCESSADFATKFELLQPISKLLLSFKHFFGRRYLIYEFSNCVLFQNGMSIKHHNFEAPFKFPLKAFEVSVCVSICVYVTSI